MSESWIVKHVAIIQRLLYNLEEHQMRDTSGDFDFHNVKYFISEQFKEINRLEGVCKLKDQEYNKLKEEYNVLYNKIFQSDENPEPETPQPQDGFVEEGPQLPDNKKRKHPWARKK